MYRELMLAALFVALIAPVEVSAQQKPKCGQRKTVEECYKCSIESGGLNKFSASGISNWCAQKVGSRRNG